MLEHGGLVKFDVNFDAFGRLSHEDAVLVLRGLIRARETGPRPWEDGDERCHCTPCEGCGKLFRTVDVEQHRRVCLLTELRRSADEAPPRGSKGRAQPRKLHYDSTHDCSAHGAASNDTRLGCRMCATQEVVRRAGVDRQRSYWLAGETARAIVLDHDRRLQEATEKLYEVMGLTRTALLLKDGVFEGYRPIAGELPLPGFVPGRGQLYGWLVLGRRSAEGKRLAEIAKAHRLPSQEDRTKALCGEPWCLIQFHQGVLDEKTRSYTYGVIYADPNIILTAPKGARTPIDSVLLDPS